MKWQEGVVAYFRKYPSMRLVRVRTTKILSTSGSQHVNRKLGFRIMKQVRYPLKCQVLYFAE
jgi:hypothetical protein